MNMRNLLPWGRQQMTAGRSRDEGDPFMTLHREMNRLFDDVMRGFEPGMFGSPSMQGSMSRMGGAWPSMEVVESDKDVRITAELPGLEEKDVEVLMKDGVLTIRGERKSETEDKDRAFSERYYGRFERRIPIAWEIDPDKVEASFKNGLLTVTMPKTPQAASQVRRIAINSADATKH